MEKFPFKINIQGHELIIDSEDYARHWLIYCERHNLTEVIKLIKERIGGAN